MAERVKTHAPYNFVPFSNKVLLRYDSPDQLPPHNVWNAQLKSGEIHVTLRAETPVLVSDGQEKYHARFVKGADGTYQIPGSTVRGLLRQTMQILGFGHIRSGEDLKDRQFFFRRVAADNQTVLKQQASFYKNALDITQVVVGKQRKTMPRAVRCGYLYEERGDYKIQPTAGMAMGLNLADHPALKQFAKKNQVIHSVWYQLDGKRVKAVQLQHHPAMEPGMLLITGRKPGNRDGSGIAYLFPNSDNDTEPIAVNKEDILFYQVDLEQRINQLGGNLKTLKNPMRESNPRKQEANRFWGLPLPGEKKPVFYLQYNGHLYFGTSKMMRIPYPHRISDGLPQKHRDLDRKYPVALDYAHAVMGFATEKQSYASRVSVSAFPLEGTPKLAPEQSVVLGEPKESYFPTYVEKAKHYGEDSFQLRGHKRYWYRSQPVSGTTGNNRDVNTVLHPLDRGSTFHGVIRYRNLYPDELGLLLWCIRLNPGCFHAIGMGKPYGYGRMSVTIDQLLEWNSADLYTPEGLASCGTETKHLTDAVETYIRNYCNYAAPLLRAQTGCDLPLPEQPEILDFLYLCSIIRSGDEISYMSHSEHSWCINALPSVEELRKETPELPVQEEDYLQALKNHFRPI